MKAYDSKNDQEIAHLQSKVQEILQSHHAMKREVKESMDKMQQDISSKFDLLLKKMK